MLPCLFPQEKKEPGLSGNGFGSSHVQRRSGRENPPQGCTLVLAFPGWVPAHREAPGGAAELRGGARRSYLLGGLPTGALPADRGVLSQPCRMGGETGAEGAERG